MANFNKKQKKLIAEGSITEYIPNKQNYSSFAELAMEYRDKIYEWVRVKGDLLPTEFFQEHGYLLKPDSPAGSVDTFDIFRLDNMKRYYWDGMLTPGSDLLPKELGWGGIKGLKSPYNLEKLNAHHIRGLMQESPFLAGLTNEQAQEVITKMWKSGRLRSGSQFYNRIDLEEFMHQNPYEAKLLERFRALDPDAGAYIGGKWVGWEKKSGKWTNPLYQGTGIHDLLAEHQISSITGGSLFSDDTQGMLRGLGDNLDARFNAWSTWYDYTDEEIDRLLLQSQIDPRNIRGGLSARTGFKELAKRAAQGRQTMDKVLKAYPDLTPEAITHLEYKLLGPDPKRQAALDLLRKEGDPKVIRKTQEQVGAVSEALRRDSAGGLINNRAGRELGEQVVTKGGKKFIRKFGGKLIPWVAPAAAGVGFWADIQSARADPSIANLTRVGLSGIETGAEVVAGVGLAAAPFTGGATLVPAGGAKGVSTAAGGGNLGSYVVEHRDRIWDTVKDPGTYRKLYGNTRDFLVEKVTDDKGISSLWHDEEKEREKGYARLNAEGRNR